MALRIRQFQNEHVFGEPALIARLYRCDPQGVAFFSQQRIAAVTRSKRPNLSRFREMTDVFVFGVARPSRILLIGPERRSDRVQTFHKITVRSEGFDYSGTDTRHDVHVGNDVW